MPSCGTITTKHACFTSAQPMSIADAGAVLVTSPANAKSELVKHIGQHDPRLMKVIVGVQAVDHPSDKQLVAFAKYYLSRRSDATAARCELRFQKVRPVWPKPHWPVVQ